MVLARRASLRAKRANRHARGGPVRPAVYLAESYINVNQATPRTWYCAEDGPWGPKRSGKGPRFIIVPAMTTAGGVQGAPLVFRAKRRTGDYHGQMDWANVRRGLCRSFLPPMPAASRIVRDKAPSHNVDVDGVF